MYGGERYFAASGTSPATLATVLAWFPRRGPDDTSVGREDMFQRQLALWGPKTSQAGRVDVTFGDAEAGRRRALTGVVSLGTLSRVRSTQCPLERARVHSRGWMNHHEWLAGASRSGPSTTDEEVARAPVRSVPRTTSYARISEGTSSGTPTTPKSSRTGGLECGRGPRATTDDVRRCSLSFLKGPALVEKAPRELQKAGPKED
mmetsp:Transcript_8899/g.28920  ORF Transcript_8899/g.28920 Transcript_8899/m.28920 type:complete len:204 (-) Transcript_8899:396-1007(-)